MGTITSVGGGTVRDVVLLNRVPFWIEEWEYLIFGGLASVTAFFAFPT